MAVESAPAHIIDQINAHIAEKKPFVAFEYFPPRTAEGVTNLYARMERMAKQQPLYMDVTWGAGGTTSDLTLELCVETKKRYGVETNMHLTCTNMPEEKIDIALEGAKAGGVTNILALRGDPPVGAEKWEAVAGGFSCALDLVKHIRAKYDTYFDIAVAGYPEGHPAVIKKVEEGRTLSEDELTRVITMEDGQYVCSDADYAGELAYLKQKVDAGASFIVTQMFFDADVFFKFVKDCRTIGINVPIVPGIMVIQAYGGFKRMTAFCKSRVPAAVHAALDAVKDDEDAVKAEGVRIGTEMCKALLDGGAPGLHFYTLNLENVTNGILKNLGLFHE